MRFTSFVPWPKYFWTQLIVWFITFIGAFVCFCLGFLSIIFLAFFEFVVNAAKTMPGLYSILGIIVIAGLAITFIGLWIEEFLSKKYILIPEGSEPYPINVFPY